MRSADLSRSDGLGILGVLKGSRAPECWSRQSMLATTHTPEERTVTVLIPGLNGAPKLYVHSRQYAYIKSGIPGYVRYARGKYRQ